MFGDLSQLRDISLTRDYAGMCGITEDELRSSLSSELRGLAPELGLDADGCLGVLRTQYGGYCFHPDGPKDTLERTSRCVHNPRSLVRALKERRLGSWRFETGTCDLLVRRMRTWGLEPAELADGTIEAEEERLRDVRCDDPEAVPLLFQTGCLTIRGRDAEGVFELGVRYGDVERGLVR